MVPESVAAYEGGSVSSGPASHI